MLRHVNLLFSVLPAHCVFYRHSQPPINKNLLTKLIVSPFTQVQGGFWSQGGRCAYHCAATRIQEQYIFSLIIATLFPYLITKALISTNCDL
jgi:hypothetical protein